MKNMGLLCVLLVAIGCGKSDTPVDESQTITLATTTSTRDSGLLDVLVPLFTEQTGIAVKVVAVGSGQALEMGRRGDADLLLTHAPVAEEAFMSEGFGAERRAVMSNDFVLIGPKSAADQLAKVATIQAALQEIEKTELPFVSRGDESGTHMKETALWQAAGIEPVGEWYIESGSGMAQTLRIANEKQACTLADRGTYLAHRDGLELHIVREGDAVLKNPYAVILIDPKKHPHVQADAARAFADFLTADDTQEVIREFGVDRYEQPLFFPNP
jgi:tungstate transport system substrate-binding protein